MPWVKVPPENHPLFRAALPEDPRVETQSMFGGVAAKVNGHVFAGLFGLSTMVWLPEPDRAKALALAGAALFDPMGNGRSDKVMLPESVMHDPIELRRWLGRAFQAAASCPLKHPRKRLKAARLRKRRGVRKQRRGKAKKCEAGVESLLATSGSVAHRLITISAKNLRNPRKANLARLARSCDSVLPRCLCFAIGYGASSR